MQIKPKSYILTLKDNVKSEHRRIFTEKEGFIHVPKKELKKLK